MQAEYKFSIERYEDAVELINCSNKLIQLCSEQGQTELANKLNSYLHSTKRSGIRASMSESWAKDQAKDILTKLRTELDSEGKKIVKEAAMKYRETFATKSHEPLYPPSGQRIPEEMTNPTVQLEAALYEIEKACC